MRKQVKDLNEVEFLNLIESGKFRIKTEEELIAEGWNCVDDKLEYNGDELNIDILSIPLTVSNIMEVDTYDSTFKANLGLKNWWFPMDVIEYSDFKIDPIVLNIPNEDDIFPDVNLMGS